MTTQYIQIAYEDYKALEAQMRAFSETTHKSEAGFYHKAIRLKITSDLTMEFHGPLVLAGQTTLEPEDPDPAVTEQQDTKEEISEVLPCDHLWSLKSNLATKEEYAECKKCRRTHLKSDSAFPWGAFGLTPPAVG